MFCDFKNSSSEYLDIWMEILGFVQHLNKKSVQIWDWDIDLKKRGTQLEGISALNGFVWLNVDCMLLDWVVGAVALVLPTEDVERAADCCTWELLLLLAYPVTGLDMVRTRLLSLKCRSSSISREDSLSLKCRQSASRRSTSIWRRRCNRTFSSLITFSSRTSLAMFSLWSRSVFSRFAFKTSFRALKLRLILLLLLLLYI